MKLQNFSFIRSLHKSYISVSAFKKYNYTKLHQQHSKDVPLRSCPSPACAFLGQEAKRKFYYFLLACENEFQLQSVCMSNSASSTLRACLSIEGKGEQGLLALGGKKGVKYNNNSWQSMKYKKELRWLLFLLVPFVLMLCLHILIPIELVASGHALQNQSYAVESNNLAESTLQSQSITSSLALQSSLNSYAASVRLINGLKAASFTLLEPLSTLTMNSAFLFSQGINNNSSINQNGTKQSMWFATNCSNPQKLSPTLRKLYDSYGKKEGMVRALTGQGGNGAFYSLSTLLVRGNESIVFEYPTRSSATYANLSSSAYMDEFSGIMIQMQQSGLTQVERADLKWVPQLNTSVLVLCVGSVYDAVTEITCQQLKIEAIMDQLAVQMGMGVGLSVSSQCYLLLNTHQGSTTPQIIYQTQNKNRVIEAPTNAFINPGSLGLPSSVFSAKPYCLGDRLYISVYNRAVSLVSGVALGQMNAFSLLTVSSYQQNGVQTVDLSQNLNALIIPVAILIVIGSLISAIVLKVLLDSLDKELYELEHRCQFIVEGDAHIEIPQYQGTKDIQELYRQVKIINKLHRYTISDYFRGHFAQKVLKYTECLEFLGKIGYDTGNILENIGQSIMLVEEWEKAIDYFKRAVQLAINELKSRFGITMQQFLKMKVQKKAFPVGLKEFQMILRRRLFKLTFANIKYVELRQMAAKTVSKAEEQAFKNKVQALVKEWTYYLDLLKMAFYPEFSGSSQCLISLIFESKQYANLKQNEHALKLLQSTRKYAKTYIEQYPQVTRKLREKGSQFKLLHLKNKLTTHSRVNPEVIKCMISTYTNRIKLQILTHPDRYNQAVKEFMDGITAGSITLTMYYLFVIDFRKILVDLKIDPAGFESTQMFKQACPFKTLYYGEMTKEVEASLLKFPTKLSPGLQREYLVVVDCSKPKGGDATKTGQYFAERADHIFVKHMRKTDRLSIMKFNMRNGINVECKLTLKESHERILKKELKQAFKEPKHARGSLEETARAFCMAVNRVKTLQSEKIILMFFRSIAHYQRIARKKRTTEDSLRTQMRIQDSTEEGVSPESFGQVVLEALRADQLRNCKVMFFCALEDSLESFRAYFGLDQVNRKIGGRYNKRNNLVYLIDEKHRLDVDRILMMKVHDAADNHVFIL